MIVVNVEAVVEPGAIAGVRDALARMEEASRKEPGCEVYAFSVDVTNPGVVRVTERWKTMDALREHFRAPHMAAFQQALGALQPKSLEVKAYEATEVALPA